MNYFEARYHQRRNTCCGVELVATDFEKIHLSPEGVIHEPCSIGWSTTRRQHYLLSTLGSRSPTWSITLLIVSRDDSRSDLKPAFYNRNGSSYLFNQVNNSPPRRLWQQTRHATDHFLLFTLRRATVDDLWTNRMRFPEPDEVAVKIQPIPIHNFPNRLPDICASAVGTVLVGNMNRDPPQVSMVGGDGFE